jgi:hypothetical protein
MPKNRPDPRRRLDPMRIAIAFGVFGGLWIALSDLVVARLVSDPTHLTLLQSAKGLGFVLAGAFFVYLVARTDRSRMAPEKVDDLRALDRAIASSHDLPLVLGLLIEQALSALGADAASILLLDPATNTLVEADSRGLRQGMRRQELGQSAAGRAAREGRLVQIADVTAGDDEVAQVARESGFTGYHAVPLRAQRGVVGVLELFHRGPLEPSPAWLASLDGLAAQAAIALSSVAMLADLERSNAELSLAYEATIEGWARALDLRDHETEGHSRRVTDTTLRLARRLGVPAHELVHVRRGALLHDIGKMGVPDAILLKPAPLTAEEWAVMKQHPGLAYELLAPIEFLRPALDIPDAHHERWDGGGYPRGLRGEEIPLAARIFAVADVFDALTSDRPYADARHREEAIRHIRAESGRQFDPRVVEAA